MAALLAVLCLAACTPRTPAAVRTVVTLGDSVPAGSACGCTPFPDLYAEARQATDVNLASPGSTSADVLVAVTADRDILSTAAEVIVMTGANDIASSFDDPAAVAGVAATVEANVSAAIAGIERIRRIPVIVLGYWNVVLDGKVAAAQYGTAGVRAAAAATTAVNKALRTAASGNGATYVSTEAAFHGDDGTHDPTNLLAPDGDHPNAAGHAAIAALIPPLPAG